MSVNLAGKNDQAMIARWLVQRLARLFRGANIEIEISNRIYVRQLRQKIEGNPRDPKVIITESGVGYRFMT